ncbi:GTPase [Candidatus Riflebacteria bacterium]
MAGIIYIRRALDKSQKLLENIKKIISDSGLKPGIIRDKQISPQDFKRQLLAETNQLLLNMSASESPIIISVCGAANSGKSTVFNVLCQNEAFSSRIGDIAGFTKNPLAFSNSRWKSFFKKSAFFEDYSKRKYQKDEKPQKGVLSYFLHALPYFENVVFIDTPDINTAFFDSNLEKVEHANRTIALDSAYLSHIIILLLTPQTYADKEVILFTRQLIAAQKEIYLVFNFLDKKSLLKTFKKDFFSKLFSQKEENIFDGFKTFGLLKQKGKDVQKKLRRDLSSLFDLLKNLPVATKELKVQKIRLLKNLEFYMQHWEFEYRSYQSLCRTLAMSFEDCNTELVDVAELKVAHFLNSRIEAIIKESQKSYLTWLYLEVAGWFIDGRQRFLKPGDSRELAAELAAACEEILKNMQKEWKKCLNKETQNLPYSSLTEAIQGSDQVFSWALERIRTLLEDFVERKEKAIQDFVDKELPIENVVVKHAAVLIIFTACFIHDGGLASGPVAQWLGAQALIDKLNDPQIRDSVRSFIENIREETEVEINNILRQPLREQHQKFKAALAILETNLGGLPELRRLVEDLG